MNGAIIAFDPCHACESHDMCSRCELTLRRDGTLRTDKWISVEERLPEVGDDYLIVLKEKYEWEKEWRYHVDVASFSIKWDCIFNDWDEGQEIHITHWMPLPEPPHMKG